LDTFGISNCIYSSLPIEDVLAGISSLEVFEAQISLLSKLESFDLPLSALARAEMK